MSATADAINVPVLTPKPIASGTYHSNAEIHFFLCTFHAMDQLSAPNVEKLASTLARFHRKAISPNGKYGFPVTIYQGNLPQYTNWETSWEKFFYKNMEKCMEFEDQAQGSDPEVTTLKTALLEKVIPRLLRPLETGGRNIVPCLIHNDLWDGNLGVLEEEEHIGSQADKPACYSRHGKGEAGEPIIFDPTALFAHNECRLSLCA